MCLDFRRCGENLGAREHVAWEPVAGEHVAPEPVAHTQNYLHFVSPHM